MRRVPVFLGTFLLAAALPGAGQSDGNRANRLDGESKPAADFTLLTQDAKPFTLSKDGAGRPLIVTFIFSSCPGACPLVVDECIEAARQAGKGRSAKDRPIVLAVSFDPEVDTPARLKQHMKESRLSPRDIVFLTGTKEAVGKVVHDWGVSVGRDKDGDIFHGFQTVVLDRSGRIVAKYFGAGIERKDLLADVKTASAPVQAAP
ncbi:MAG: SCO family protein [Thermoanaerobaculia bacterium]|nr:SCO family protein [Thermoanaerobaculia bacterium]